MSLVGANAPSPKLIANLKAAANGLVNFGQLWQDVLTVGKVEGFSQAELEVMIRPYLKESLENFGLEPNAIKCRVYRLLNKDKEKTYNDTRKSVVNDHMIQDNDIEESSSDESEELKTLREENREYQRQLHNMSFDDNPDIFQMNKKVTLNETEGFMDTVNGIEAIGILKLHLRKEKRYEIAWRSKY